MPLVSSGDVLAILDPGLSPETDLTPFITMAHLRLMASPAGTAYTEEYLTEMERLLAAHLACLQFPRFTYVQTAGEAMSLEVGKAGEGLAATGYGRALLDMDIQGFLATETNTKRASFRVD